MSLGKPVTMIRNRPHAVLAIALVLLLAVALFDWWTGPDFAMGLLYLLPVILVTFVLGRTAGLLMVVVTMTVWVSAEILGAATYSRRWVIIPNALMRAFYMSLMVYLAAVWQKFRQQLEAQVRQRTRELVAEVAERKAAEEAVHRLGLQIANAEDAERRRIAQDIHDTVGQTLTLMKFRLQAATTATVAAIPHAPSDSRGDAYVGDALELLDQAIKQTRSLTFELYPPMIDDLGLAAGLRWLARELARQAQTQIDVAEEGPPRALPQSVASYLFRSIRELINNAIKHGQSSEIVVTLYWRPSSLRAVVDDNGTGFDAAAGSNADRPVGLGLASIRERVTTLGGTLSVESAIGSGTRAIIDIPLQ